MKKIEIKYLTLDEIIPYANNPRHNDVAVDKVVASIKEFGFKNPIILDKENVIVAGHTRLLASRRLKLDKVPCIYADDLTPQQIRAFRIADNRTAEEAQWDIEKLNIELEGLENLFTGFDKEEEAMFKSIQEIDKELENYEEPEPVFYHCPQCQYEAEKKEFEKK